jgi:hypothetical protein
MKRFILSILAVTVFFIGVGALVQNTGARFKSDEKALDLIQKARQAIGGDTAIAAIQSMHIVGHSVRSFKADGAQRTAEGETEIALLLPDKLMRSVNIVSGDEAGGATRINERQMNVEVMNKNDGDHIGIGRGEGRGLGVGTESGEKKVVLRINENGVEKELTGADAEKWIAEHHAEGDGANKVFILKEDGTGEKRIVIKVDDGTGHKELTGADAEKWVADHPGDIGVARTLILKKPGGTTEEVGGNNERQVVIRRGDGDKAEFKVENGKALTGEGNKVMFNRVEGGAAREAISKHNELLRLTLGLLLTAPKGVEVNYTLGGDGNVDGIACNIVNAEFDGQTYRLYFDKSSNLPVMLSYAAMTEPMVVSFKTAEPKTGGTEKDTVFLTKTLEGPPSASVECSVKYSDYRNVNGVQLPYKWTQSTGADTNETFDITSYEINPANIADKFQNQNVMYRVKKPADQK